ncbi:MAG TPA: hypothetical protein VGO98_00050 [Candidatus Saccharimonadales bacterium]|jgi:hypothetical protein|nr:hypothetical protein [Candidatus Saccharimonadales bacterium]
MALNTNTHLGVHQFTGPVTNTSYLPALSGVYLIATIAPNGQHTVIDVGESHNLQHRIKNHDRAPQWQRNMQNGLYAWTYLANEFERMNIEKAHRIAYNPVCGER